jgi:hypothetical protein
LRQKLWILGAFRGKLELHVDFVIKSVGLPSFDVVKYPVLLLGCNFEKRLINSFV